MNKFYKIIVTTLATAMISLPALAAPHDRFDDRFNDRGQRHAAPHVNPHANKWQPQGSHFKAEQRHKAQRWQVQHQLPKMYHNSNYKVSSYQRHQLSKPGFNQQWYKVDGHYLLANTKNHTILKVVPAI